jgi:hypothetical protein
MREKYYVRFRNWLSLGLAAAIFGDALTLTFIEGNKCTRSQIASYRLSIYSDGEYFGRSRTEKSERTLKLAVIEKLKEMIGQVMNKDVVGALFEGCLKELTEMDPDFKCNFVLTQEHYNAFRKSYQIILKSYPPYLKIFRLDESSLFEVFIKYNPAVKFTSGAEKLFVDEMGFSISSENTVDFNFSISSELLSSKTNGKMNMSISNFTVESLFNLQRRRTAH